MLRTCSPGLSIRLCLVVSGRDVNIESLPIWKWELLDPSFALIARSRLPAPLKIVPAGHNKHAFHSTATFDLSSLLPRETSTTTSTTTSKLVVKSTAPFTREDLHILARSPPSSCPSTARHCHIRALHLHRHPRVRAPRPTMWNGSPIKKSSSSFTIFDDNSSRQVCPSSTHSIDPLHY